MSASTRPAELGGTAALARGQRHQVHCERMVHGGACLARLGSGSIIFVEGAIPGEDVVAALTIRRGGTWFARAVELIKASPKRVFPPCPYVPDCGGCQLQHIDYAWQLELKREVVRDAMRRSGVELPGMVAVHGMPDPWRYRWRGEFHVVPGVEGMRDARLGFKRTHSWTPIAVDDCFIHHSTITGALSSLRQLIHEGARSQIDVLHVTVGEGGAELLVRARPEAALDDSAVDRVAATPRPAPERWATQATTLHWRNLQFRVTPEAFVQVNWEQMDILYELVVESLQPLRGARIIDAYAGVGVLSNLLVLQADLVVCIEANREAARLGVLNAQLNGVEQRLRYLPQAVEDALPEVAAGETFDAVILDPPRAGCDPKVTGWMALAGPRQAVYMSCDPATMARDLRLLVRSGPYRITSFDIVDMFPQTYHVECVAVLTRFPQAARRPGAGSAAPL